MLMIRIFDMMFEKQKFSFSVTNYGETIFLNKSHLLPAICVSKTVLRTGASLIWTGASLIDGKQT